MTNWRAVGVGFVLLVVIGTAGVSVPAVGQLGAGLVGGFTAGYLAGGGPGRGAWHGLVAGSLAGLVVAVAVAERTGAVLGRVVRRAVDRAEADGPSARGGGAFEDGASGERTFEHSADPGRPIALERSASIGFEASRGGS